MRMQDLIGVVENADSTDDMGVDTLKAEIEQGIIKGNGLGHNSELQRIVMDAFSRFIDRGSESAWHSTPDEDNDFINLSDPEAFSDKYEQPARGHQGERSAIRRSDLYKEMLQHARKFRNHYLSSETRKERPESPKTTLIKQIADKSSLGSEELSILGMRNLKVLVSIDDPSDMAHAFNKMIDELAGEQGSW